MSDKAIAELREMDQWAYQISQCDNFERMRPYIQQMIDAAARRQQNESNRISNLMVREIREAYSESEPAKLTEQPPTRLLTRLPK